MTKAQAAASPPGFARRLTQAFYLLSNGARVYAFFPLLCPAFVVKKMLYGTFVQGLSVLQTGMRKAETFIVL